MTNLLLISRSCCTAVSKVLQEAFLCLSSPIFR